MDGEIKTNDPIAEAVKQIRDAAATIMQVNARLRDGIAANPHANFETHYLLAMCRTELIRAWAKLPQPIPAEAERRQKLMDHIRAELDPGSVVMAEMPVNGPAGHAVDSATHK